MLSHRKSKTTALKPKGSTDETATCLVLAVTDGSACLVEPCVVSGTACMCRPHEARRAPRPVDARECPSPSLVSELLVPSRSIVAVSLRLLRHPLVRGDHLCVFFSTAALLTVGVHVRATQALPLDAVIPTQFRRPRVAGLIECRPRPEFCSSHCRWRSLGSLLSRSPKVHRCLTLQESFFNSRPSSSQQLGHVMNCFFDQPETVVCSVLLVDTSVDQVRDRVLHLPSQCQWARCVLRCP